jgi:hypothetical protein
VAALEKAIELDSEFLAALELLADAYREVDFRQSLEAYRRAAEIDPKYAKERDAVQKIVAENYHTLSGMARINLPTMRSQPSQEMMDVSWYCNEIVQCVAIQGCVDGSGRNKSLFGILYSEVEPDLETHRPVGTLQIEQPSNGYISAQVTLV